MPYTPPADPGLIYEPDDPDRLSAEEHYASRDLLAAVPSTLDLRAQMPPVRSQGSRGTCAAFAAAAIKEWQEHADSGYKAYMSPEFIYQNRTNKPNRGMLASDVMRILAELGTCPEEELAYQSKDRDLELADEVKESAARFRVAECARVNTIDGLKTALYQSGPCYIGMPVYGASALGRSPEFWRANGARTGGHALCVVGYTKKGFILRNSWGKLWNGDGHVIYPYEDFGAHWHIYALIDERGSPLPPYKLSVWQKIWCCN